MKLLLIDNRVREIDIITKSLETDVVSIIFDYENETLEGLKSKIPINQYESVGIVQDQDDIPSYTLAKKMGDYDLNDYGTWTPYIELIDWVTKNLGIKFWDLIECNIDETWDNIITSLQNQFNITIRSSSKQLGNTNLGDNWVFDDGTSLIGIYFTTYINEYPYTLGTGWQNYLETFIDNIGNAWVKPTYVTDAQTPNTTIADTFITAINGYGTLGQGNTNPYKSNQYILIPLPYKCKKITQVDGGMIFLLNDGNCYACGNNSNFRLGLPLKLTPTDVTYSTPTLITFSGLSQNEIIDDITSGKSYTIFKTSLGNLYCCGRDSNSGIPVSNPTSDNQLTKSNITDVYAVSAFWSTTIIVKNLERTKIYLYGKDGGENNWYTITNETYTVTRQKTINTTTTILKIECGGPSLYYIDIGNNLWGYGWNHCGQLGQGTSTVSNNTTNLTSFSKIRATTVTGQTLTYPLDAKVKAISSSYLSLQIITTDNKLYICGYIPYLQGGYSSSNIHATYTTPSTATPPNYTGFPTEISGVIVSSTEPYVSSTLLFIQDQTTFTYLPKVSSIFKVNNNFKTIKNFTTPNYNINEIGVNDQFRSLAIITNDKKTYFIGKLPSNLTYTKFQVDTTYNSGNNSTFITFTNGGFLYNYGANINAYGYNYYGELNTTLYTGSPLANSTQYSGTSPITPITYTSIDGKTYTFSYTFKISSCLNHTIVIYDIVSKLNNNPDVNKQVVYVNGLNNYGQLGNETKNSTSNNNITITFTNTIKSVCCGLLSSYFLDNSGNLYVCGYNGNSELGINIQNDYPTFSASPYNYIHKPRHVPVLGTCSQIACGYSHAIVLKSDGRCYVCGSNDYNQLGLSSATSNSYTILKNVDTVDTSTILYNVIFKYIYAGENRSAGITSTGWLYTWGRDINATPKLTDKNVTSVYQVTDIGIIYVKNKIYYVAFPTTISPYIDFSYLTTTSNTAIIKDNISTTESGNIQAYNNKINALNNCINTYLDFSGNVWVKPFNGNNNSSTGILGQGNFTNPSTEEILKVTVSDIVQTQQIGDGQIFLKRDGKCYACGLNTNYKLGLPSLDVAYATPTEISALSALGQVKYISCGYSHSMFLLNNGHLYVCGTSGYGATMLRDVSDCDANVLTKVAENVYLVSCNRDTTMIVKTTDLTKILLYGVDGRYTDWSTTSTALGKTTNTSSESNIPSKDSSVKLSSMSAKIINQIICGGPTFYYIDEDNNLWGAGFNNCGQLGQGTSTTSEKGAISRQASFVNIKGYSKIGQNQATFPLENNVLTVSSAYVSLQILTLTGDLYICGLKPWASKLAFNINNSDFNFDGVASGNANGDYYNDTPVSVATNVTDVYSNIISNNGSNEQYVECVYVTTETTGTVTSRVYKKIINGANTILDTPTTAGTTPPRTNITPITSTNIINFKRNITLIDGERKIQCIGDFTSNNATATEKTKFSKNSILNGTSGIDTDANNIFNIHSLIDGFVCYIQEKNNYNTIKIKTFNSLTLKTYDSPSYLTSGLNHFFYIDSSAEYVLKTMGLNNYGQAGTGTNSDTKLTSINDIQSIDNLKGNGKLKSACCGLFSSYFLDNSGNLYVCGYNFNNELGSSFQTTTSPVTDVSNNLFLLDIVKVKQTFSGTGTITQVACGYNHSILIITNVTGGNTVNTVWTCGLNNYGQLGQGNNNIVTTYTKIQITTSGNTTDISFNSIYAGENRCAGITSDNKLYTWGRDIGNSPLLQDLNVSAVYKVTDIGIFYIKNDLKYYVSNVKIGNNLVLGMIQDNSTPAKPIYSYNKLNNLNNCIQTYLDIDGYAWVQSLPGNTNTTTSILGQLNNTPDNTGNFNKVKLTAETYLSDIIQTQQVDGGQLFLKRNGTCWACGNNADYRLGLPLKQIYSTPTEISVLSALGEVKYISCGYSYSMFLFFNGDLYVCGKSGYGATALPTRGGDITGDTLKRVKTDVKFVSCSRDTTMIVFSNELKKVYIYGIDGTDKDWKTKTKATDILVTDTSINSFKTLSVALDIKKIVCGGPSIYCIDVSYNLWGAGFNNCGQLGQSNTTSIVSSWTQIKGTLADSLYPLDNKVLTISSAYVSLQIVTLTGKLYICGLKPWTTTEIFKSFINTGDFDGLPKDSSTNCLFTPTEVTAENPVSPDTIIKTHITDVYSNIISYNNTTRYVGFYYVTHTQGTSKYKTLTSESLSLPLNDLNLIKGKKYTFPLLDNENKIWVLGERGDDMYGTNTFTNTNQLTYELKSTNKIKNTIRGIVLYDTNQQINTIGTSLYGEKGSGSYTMSDYDTNLYHSLYVTNTYDVYSIGLNNYGQLGTENIENYIDINSLSYNYKSSLFLLNTSQNSKISYFTGKNITKVCCGLYTSYFLSNTNFLYACGYNFNNEFGKKSWTTIASNKIENVLTNNYELTPVILPFNCSNIVCGDNHSIVVKTDTDKTIWCCGLNNYGQLGLGNTNTYTNYQQLSLPANVTSFDYLYAGENRSAGITSDDKLYTWGKDIGNSPLLQDLNVSAVYKVTDIGIIYIKNNKYYVANAKANDILSAYSTNSTSAYITYSTTTPQATNPIIPYDNSILKLTNFIKTYISKVGIPYVVPLFGFDNTTGILGQLDKSTRVNNVFLKVVLSESNDLSDIVQTQQVFGGQIFLKRDGKCYACGSNRYNSLGLNKYNNSVLEKKLNINTPTMIEFPLSTPLVKYISCAGNRSMFLLINGDVYVCGKGGNGESTLANTVDYDSNTMTKTTLSNIFLIGSSVYKTYFVKADELKKIYYCGYGVYLANNSFLSTPTNIKKIEIGVDSIYYIDEDNNLYGYGKNNCGQLGTGDTTDKTEWTRIRGVEVTTNGKTTYPLDNNVLTISSAFITLQIVTLNGELYICGLKPDNSDIATFSSSIYNTPISSNYYITTPTKIDTITNVTNVYSNIIKFVSNTTNNYVSCVYVSDSKYKELGFSNNTSLTLNNPISNLKYNSTDIIPIANTNVINFNRNINLINTNGDIYSLGKGKFNDINNQLIEYSSFTKSDFLSQKSIINIYSLLDGFIAFLNTTPNTIKNYKSTPTIDSTGSYLSTGINHSFIYKNGALNVIGLNNYSQLANGTIEDITTLTSNTTLSYIKSACCGLHSSYFLKNSGELYVCGYNFNNELGINFKSISNNTTEANYLYIKSLVKIDGTYSQVVCGYNHSIIVKMDLEKQTQTIWSCGLNNYGQLGLGNTNIYSEYTEIINKPTFTHLFAGENRSAGLTSTGWLYCWGRNIGLSPVLTDKNVQNVYLITDIGIIYIKNRQYYVAYATDILSNLSNPIPSIIPYDKSSLPLTIYSNICFLEGTQVKCDQGLIEIDKINPNIHTISNKKIVAITETYSTEKELALIEKDSIRPNVPNKTTPITLEHKIYYKGKMMEAGKITKNRKKYNGERLYNVLMEEHNKMSVNNMIVETLDPANSIGNAFKWLRENNL